MGNDGGTIAKRQDILSLHGSDDLSKSQASGAALNDRETSVVTTCALSSLPLYSDEAQPIVGDYKGKLYLKEKIIEFLISKKLKKSNRNDKLKHISSIKDLVDVKLTWGKLDGTPRIKCPVLDEIKTKSNVFAYSRSCGCVVSQKILKTLSQQTQTSDINCPSCSHDLSMKYDVVLLNPTDQQDLSEVNSNTFKKMTKDLGVSHSKRTKKDKVTHKGKSTLSENKVHKKL